MHEEDIEVRGLSQVAKYTLTAVLLGIITAVEVLVLYPPLAYAGDAMKIALLAVLGITKFIIVVALFMHLWHDNPIFTGIFAMGMVIGAGTLVGLLALFSYYPLPENAVKAPPIEEIHEKRRKMQQGGGESHDEHSSLAPWFRVAGDFAVS